MLLMTTKLFCLYDTHFVLCMYFERVAPNDTVDRSSANTSYILLTNAECKSICTSRVLG